jgi:hypothetical protein
MNLWTLSRDTNMEPKGLFEGLPTGANLALDLTPIVGDIKAGVEAVDYASKGRYTDSILAAAGLLPFVPSLAKYAPEVSGMFGRVAKEAPKEPENIMMMVAGNKGLQRFISNANDDQIDQIEVAVKAAKKLKDGGASITEQAKETGFWFGKDGKLRFEVPDTGAFLKEDITKLPDNTEMKVGDLLSHPLIYDFYPELKDATVRLVNKPKSTHRGAYYYDSGVIELNTAHKDFKNPINSISTTLHEAQHGIQETENFLRGGNWRSYLKDKKNPTAADIKEAQGKYLKEYGEAESRNVQLRFEDPLFEKMAAKQEIPFTSKVKDTAFPETMGQDIETEAFFGQPLRPEDLSYTDPFGRP